MIFVVFRLVRSKNRGLSNIHQCSLVSMEPSSVRNKILGVLNIVAPLHFSTKGIAFRLWVISEKVYYVAWRVSLVFFLKKPVAKSISDTQNQ